MRVRFLLDRFLAVLLLAVLTAAPPIAYAGHKSAHSQHMAVEVEEASSDSHPDLHADGADSDAEPSHHAHSHDDGSVDHSHEPGGHIIIQVFENPERPSGWRETRDTSVIRGPRYGLERPPRVTV